MGMFPPRIRVQFPKRVIEKDHRLGIFARTRSPWKPMIGMFTQMSGEFGKISSETTTKKREISFIDLGGS